MSPNAIRYLSRLATRRAGLATGIWYRRHAMSPTHRGRAMRGSQWATMIVWRHNHAADPNLRPINFFQEA